MRDELDAEVIVKDLDSCITDFKLCVKLLLTKSNSNLV